LLLFLLPFWPHYLREAIFIALAVNFPALFLARRSILLSVAYVAAWPAALLLALVIFVAVLLVIYGPDDGMGATIATYTFFSILASAVTLWIPLGLYWTWVGFIWRERSRAR
jgi:hypothetical protein